jgi:AraC-like DNA-binding protein
MADFYSVKSITELHESFGAPKPNHPLITVIDLSEVSVPEEMLYQKLTNPFYTITLKTKTSVEFKYGRDYFDFSEGVLLGLAPNQIIEIDEVAEKGAMEGWALYFHPDLIRESSLIDKIEDFGFFSYQANEALHLSEKEREALSQIIEKIKEEYQSNLDHFSRNILVSNIELLLNYIQRFYSRQFLTRKTKNTDVLNNFQRLLKAYFEAEDISIIGLPKVSYFAQQLNLSDSYLGDLLKNETGMHAQEHIHQFIIEKAKNRLLQTNHTVSEIAYDLGFEYPQYFSRLFKKKTGVSPNKYRAQWN